MSNHNESTAKANLKEAFGYLDGVNEQRTATMRLVFFALVAIFYILCALLDEVRDLRKMKRASL